MAVPRLQIIAERPLVVTWCTAIKRPSPGVRITEHAPSLALLGQRWISALAAAGPVDAAEKVYAGRSFSIARKSADLADADLAIVSAGLGWVSATTRIPSYELTVARGALARHINGSFDAAAWWKIVVRGPFSSDPEVDVKGRIRVLACISTEYAPFFVDALQSVPPERLRIFGSGIAHVLPPIMRSAILPYDGRFATLSSGTRADFAQRALRHYLTAIGLQGDLLSDHDAVLGAMNAQHEPVVVPRRQTLDDDALLTIIREVLPTIRTRSAMLRFLRDVRGVACEQSRFARLFASVSDT